jgi:hypothetical protein
VRLLRYMMLRRLGRLGTALILLDLWRRARRRRASRTT